jgi:integrase
MTRPFGYVRRLPSGRFQASYLGPDQKRHNAPTTFKAKVDARGWLATVEARIIEGMWRPPAPIMTLSAYANAWLADRPLKPRTRDHYRRLLDRLILPSFGDLPLESITPIAVRAWHANLGADTPTMRAHAYALLRSIMASAVDDRLSPSNPCHIRGAGNSKRVHKISALTPAELEALAAAMPARLHAMPLLAAWCGLRFGELAELRRSDLDLQVGKIKIRRAVVRAGGEIIVGAPKSDAGVRDVVMPPHLLPTLRAHVADHAQFGCDGLLFPGTGGGHLAPASLYGRAPGERTRGGWGFYAARAAIGRPDLRWHDLRHTGAVWAAATGAPLADIMARLGHSTQGAAMRYQHAVQDHDSEIARKLSAMAELATGAVAAGR